MLVDYCRLSDSIPHLTLSHTQQKEQKKGQKFNHIQFNDKLPQETVSYIKDT
jgi:hypothetical protein